MRNGYQITLTVYRWPSLTLECAYLLRLAKCFIQCTDERNTVFLRLKDGVFSFQNNPKGLDPFYKTDLDLSDCLGRVKLAL